MGGKKPTEVLCKIALLLAAASTVACFTIPAPPDNGSGTDRETEDDVDDDDDDDDGEEPGEPPPATIIDTQLSHSETPVPAAGAAIYCPKNGADENAQQSYFRVFDLDDNLFKVGADIKVNSVEFGVEYAVDAENDNQQIKVVLHSMDGAITGTENILSLAAMTEVASVDVTINNRELIGMHTTSIAATVTRDKILVAEVRVPESGGNNEARLFKLGSNPLGQTAESFFLAPQCNVNSTNGNKPPDRTESIFSRDALHHHGQRQDLGSSLIRRKTHHQISLTAAPPGAALYFGRPVSAASAETLGKVPQCFDDQMQRVPIRLRVKVSICRLASPLH